MLCCSVMLSTYGAKAWTFALQTRKRGITFFGPPRPRLSSPPHSTIPGGLLLLQDQETALNTLQLIWHKAGCHGPATLPVSEGTCDMSIGTLGSRSWVTAEAHHAAHQNGPACFQQKSHYWPVRHYMEAHKRLSSPVTCCSINQDESCGM